MNRFSKSVAVIFLLGAVYYLLMQHRAHVFQYLPLIVFMGCPLMHLFGGHGGHGQHDHPNQKG